MTARVLPSTLVMALVLATLPACSVDAASLAKLFAQPESARNQAPTTAAAEPAGPSQPDPLAGRVVTTNVIRPGQGTVTTTTGGAKPGTTAARPAQPTTGPAAPVGPTLPPGAAPLTEGTPILALRGLASPEAQLLLASLADVEAELSAALEALLAKAEVAQALAARSEQVEGLPPLEGSAPAARRLSQFGLGVGAEGLTLSGPEGSTTIQAPAGVSLPPSLPLASADFVAPVRPGRVADVLKALARRATLALDRGDDGQLVPRLSVAVGGDEVPDGRARSLSLKLDRSRGPKLVVDYQVEAKGDLPAIQLTREVSVVAGALQHQVNGKLGERVVSYLRERGGTGQGQVAGDLNLAFNIALAGPQPKAPVPGTPAANPPAAGGGTAPAPATPPDLLGDRPPFDSLPAGTP